MRVDRLSLEALAASYAESEASAKAVRITMERGGDRHFTADGSDPKSPCPGGLKCSFPCVSTLLGGSMLSAPWGDAREQTRLAGISQDAKSLTRPRPVKVEADDVAGGDRSRERAGFAFPSRLPPGDAVPQSLVHAFAGSPIQSPVAAVSDPPPGRC